MDGDHYGSAWKENWGTFEKYADAYGRTALICPECGCEKGNYKPGLFPVMTMNLFVSFERDFSLNMDANEFKLSHKGVSKVSQQAHEQCKGAKQSTAEQVGGVSGASQQT